MNMMQSVMDVSNMTKAFVYQMPATGIAVLPGKLSGHYFENTPLSALYVKSSAHCTWLLD